MLGLQPDGDTLRTAMEPVFSRCFSADLEQAYWFIDRLCLHLCFLVVHECRLLQTGPESLADLAARIGVPSSALYLLNTVLDILAEEGFVTCSENRWKSLRSCPPEESPALQRNARASCPQALATFELIKRCHEHAMSFLKGRQTGMAAIFPRGDVGLWERLHTIDRVMSVYADFVPRALEVVLAGNARVLEVGAGVGAVLQRCLPLLVRRDVQEYCFTDIGNLFVQRAHDRYGGEKFLRFMAVDLDRPLHGQALEPESFDVVIAVNVLHSARDLAFTLGQLRQMLKKSGWLICSEGSPPDHKRRWRLDLTFAFLRGWWDTCTDPVLRRRPGFLLPAEWGTALLAHGYHPVHVLPGKSWFRGPCRGGLIMAGKGRPKALESARSRRESTCHRMI
jgi:SAM-dependent methyltransferase